MKVLINLAAFSIGGFLAGVISLILLAIIPVANFSSLLMPIITGVIVEEMIKLTTLYLLLSLSLRSGTLKNFFIPVIFFGLSFSLFELLLIIIGHTNTLNSYFLLATLVHITTSLLFLASIVNYNKKRKLSTISLIFFILAFFTHLCYNLVILKFA